MKEAIERSRQQQISRKKEEKKADYQEQQEFAEFWKIRNEELVSFPVKQQYTFDC